MLDGFYSMTYRGAVDWGIGMLVLRNGVIVGADAAGALYDGSYREEGLKVRIELTMSVPPGVTLVQGGPAQPTTYRVPVSVTVPISAVELSQPILLQLPPGPVNVIFRRLRALSS